MARKVKLDVLEAHTEDRSAVKMDPPVLVPPAGDQHVSRGMPFKKWIIPGVIGAVLCLSAAGVYWAWMMTGQTGTPSPSPSPNSRPVAAIPAPHRTMADFGNFIVDYRQQGGNVRIVIFAMTVEFHAPVKSDAVQDNVDLREAIYTLSKKKSVSSLIAADGRQAFKEEIAAEVEKRLGAGVVKDVYFTKFCAL